MFSIVLIAKNEAANISACLKPLQGLTDDILVIDGFSTDGTVEICQGLGARVIPYKWLGYSGTKNFGNEQAKYDWILSMDADEVVSEELFNSLKNLQIEENTVYALDRMTDLYGTWIKHSGWYPDWKIRLFNKKQVYWEGDFVHESLFVPSGFKTVKLKGILEHYSYKNAEDHFLRIERYAQLSADELAAQGKKATFVKLYLSPIARFIKTLFFQRGILDGKAGWTIAKRNAWLVYRKYWLLRNG